MTLALALGLAAASARGDVQGFHYTREAAVPAPGWVRVPLDLAAVRHLAPGGADLHVFSPSGGEIPARLEPAPPRPGRRPADAFRMEAADDGWRLTVDVGPGLLSHQRLFLSAAHSPLPPPDRLESSPDGASWQPLARGEPETAAGEMTLAYPMTTDRYLRLHWPRRRQETPRVSAVAVEIVASPVLSVPTVNAECVPGPPGALFCTLALPAAGQTPRRITLDVEGKGLVGFRLYAPRDARWLPVAEGVWQPAGGRTRHELTPGPEPVAGAALRLELHAGGSRPRLAGWGLDLTAPTVLFRADGAGSHTLAYGGARQPEPRPAAPGGHPLWVEPGPESEHGLPALPAVATAPGVRLNERRIAASWRIAAPSARPGSLVRLELPPLVYAQARADLGNLRVLSGDRQIPFRIWSPEEPALAFADRDLRLQASGGRRSGDSAVEIHLPQPGLPLSQIALTAPSVPLRRLTALRYLEPSTTPAREVRRRARPTLVQDTWECRPQPPLPCRNLLPLPGRAPSVVEVSFQDRDNPPLAALGADLWRRRDVLLFVWPDTEEPVRLVAGSDTLTAPSYDLQALGDALLSYPWQPAELSQGRAPARLQPWWSRWMRPMTLLAAAVLLLLLLRRILMAT
ncbi:MAG: hypothetical protein DMF53_24935 [Acidobacteria bacterium]|nr:MAG: hypothetical protein DMF53_24935 [Acidobacteriota bacterium]